MLFFTDGTHRIDYVLAWETKVKDVKVAEERAAIRKVFEKNLLDEGLLLEADHQVCPRHSGGIPVTVAASWSQCHSGGILGTVSASRAQ